MEKNKRSLALCGLIAAFCLGSCLSTTDELDLDREISLDMQIGPSGLSIPLGSLSRIYLDSLIKIDGDNSVLDTLDGGLFGFTMKDSIQKVSVSISKVSINIDDTDIDPMETKFDSTEVKEVEIPEKVSSSTIHIEKVDLSTMEMPEFTSESSTGNQTVPAGSSSQKITLPAISIPQQSMNCSFSYDYPDDVKKINKIWFGTERGDKNGQKLTLTVDLSKVYNVFSNPEITITDLTITFPGEFTVGKDAGLSTYIKDSYVSANKNKFSIQMPSGTKIENLGTDKKLPVSFYLKYGDFSGCNGKIALNDAVTYNVTFVIAGTPSSAQTQQFNVDVKMQEQLGMSEIDIETNSKSVDMAKDTISSSCVVSGLDGVSRVNRITFNSSKSLLYLSFSDLKLDPFAFNSENSKIVLRFPANYEFEDYCNDEMNHNVGSWSGSTLTLSTDKVMGHTVKLKVKALDVNSDVNKETASVDILTEVIYDGHVEIDAATGLNLESLDKLSDKTLEVKVWGSFEVANAEVEIAEMRTEFDNTTEISIREKVDDQLVMIKRIDLEGNGAEVQLHLRFDGVPSTIHQLNFSRFTIEFPSFMKIEYKGSDKYNRIKTSGNKLIINGDLTDNELHKTGFTVSGLKITGLEFDDPLEIDKGYINLNEQVRITGAVTIDKQKINQDELDVIRVFPTVSFSSLDVKSVYGKVNPKIDKVHEVVALALGDDMDFFKDEKNNLTLSDPQITLNLKSTVTVPINLDLKLSSKKTGGEYIKKDLAPDHGTIHLPKCDSLAKDRTTTLIFCKKEKPEPKTDDTVYVVMSQLSELMSTVPDTIIFDLAAYVDQSVNHYVDLTRDLSVSGNYKVSVPLAFDSLYLEYNDTIKDLSKDLEDIADMIDDASLQILADVESTIPLGISLNAKAYDKNWREVSGITISPFEIKAGSDSITKSVMELGFDVRKGSLTNLESIVLTIACKSGEGSSSIRKGQWLELKKLRLRLPRGIKVDMTDSKKDDKKKK